MSEQPPSDAPFADLLCWHLQYGTRPAGRGKRWMAKKFGEAVGVDEKTVNNWVNGKRTPPVERPRSRLRAGRETGGGAGLDDICDALFGPNPSGGFAEERRALQQAHARVKGVGAPAALAPPPLAPLPPDPGMIGRDDLREQVVAAVLAGRPVVVPGGPGMGKTTLTLAAAHDSRLAATYRDRRVFVPLDAATSGDAAARALAQALGAPPAGSLRDVLGAIAQRAAAAPVLALLDNAETPDQADRAGARDVLAQLAAIGGLGLMVSVRGEANLVAGATVLGDLAPLGPDEARDLFLREAPQLSSADPDLPTLLHELDYHPLSLVLLGRAAEGERRAAPVLEDWRTQRAKILADGRGDHRLTSVRASLRASLDSPAMTAAGRRLVGLLSLAPGGLRREDCAAWIDADAPRRLLKLRLADEREVEGGARLTMLAPLREAAKLECPASEEDFGRYWAMIAAALASSEARFRSNGGSHEAAIREAENCDAALGESFVRGIDPNESDKAARALALFVQYFGGNQSVIRMSRAPTHREI